MQTEVARVGVFFITPIINGMKFVKPDSILKKMYLFTPFSFVVTEHKPFSRSSASLSHGFQTETKTVAICSPDDALKMKPLGSIN